MNLVKAKEKNVGTQSYLKRGETKPSKTLHASKEKHVSYVVFRAKVGNAVFITISEGPKIDLNFIINFQLY